MRISWFALFWDAVSGISSRLTQPPGSASAPLTLPSKTLRNTCQPCSESEASPIQTYQPRLNTCDTSLNRWIRSCMASLRAKPDSDCRVAMRTIGQCWLPRLDYHAQCGPKMRTFSEPALRYGRQIALRFFSRHKLRHTNLRSDGSFPTYSTVTDFARLRGWSTSQPRRTAMWYASNWHGTTSRIGESSSGASGT